MGVVVGIDSHKRTLAVAVVDELGKLRAAREFSNDPRSHKRLLQWAKAFDADVVIGIEGAGNYGAGLVRYLVATGEEVREVPAHRTFTERKRVPARGKSDPDDALAIARVVLSDETLPSAARDIAADELKVLVDHHKQLSSARTQAINRIHKQLVVLYPGYGDRVPRLTTKSGLAEAVKLLRGDRSVRAELVRFHVSEIRRLDQQLAIIDRSISIRVVESSTKLTELQGVGTLVAARILGEVGGRRLGSKASFAMLTGTAPIPASSGATHRHRLNRGGNRRLNHALHIVAINRMRLDPSTRDYVARKRAEGKSRKEAIRCLKRHLANVVYRQLQLDHTTT